MPGTCLTRVDRFGATDVNKKVINHCHVSIAWAGSGNLLPIIGGFGMVKGGSPCIYICTMGGRAWGDRASLIWAMMGAGWRVIIEICLLPRAIRADKEQELCGHIMGNIYREVDDRISLWWLDPISGRGGWG
ncbi:hypothetical protein PILCRDRAFT_88320 [Piloderma croceum F 1598]|uniref:Uncharacterized protein n=1 Tax=Piloderma croceum (strain F 1598) TaxID=765440 RepID=A0A0C3FTG2_PILCF|nr:hypothetical protein PILCRDRAFT_88320 [Piloderma croceum F 1598]